MAWSIVDFGIPWVNLSQFTVCMMFGHEFHHGIRFTALRCETQISLDATAASKNNKREKFNFSCQGGKSTFSTRKILRYTSISRNSDGKMKTVSS
jgi:hypothetical protein